MHVNQIVKTLYNNYCDIKSNIPFISIFTACVTKILYKEKGGKTNARFDKFRAKIAKNNSNSNARYYHIINSGIEQSRADLTT